MPATHRYRYDIVWFDMVASRRTEVAVALKASGGFSRPEAPRWFFS